MKQRLIKHIESITDPALRGACRALLDYDKFFTWPASLGFHHAYEGGLLAHTVEVCDIALGIEQISDGTREGNPFDRESSFDILIASALWHDFCKVREYYRIGGPGRHDSIDQECQPVEWKHTDYGKHVYHISGSAIEFTIAARNWKVSDSVIDAVTHCILAHHGRREWGSPVEPQTLEALILHQADMLSAKFGATKDRP